MRRLDVRTCAIVLVAVAVAGVGGWMLVRSPSAAGEPWPGDFPNAPPELHSDDARRALGPVRHAWEAQEWATVAKESEAVLAAGPPRAVEAVAAYALGDALIRQRDVDGAVHAFRRCVRVSKGTGDGLAECLAGARHRLLFCEVVGKLKDEAEATAEARRLLEEMPDAEGASMSVQLVVRHLRRSQGPKAAAAYLQDLVAEHPLKAAGRDALLQLAQMRSASGDVDGALDCYERLEEWCGQRPDWAPWADAIPRLVESMKQATLTREEAVRQRIAQSEQEKAAAEAARGVSRPTADRPMEGYAERLAALRGIVRDHGGTGVARRTRLEIAASELLYARIVLDGAGAEADKLRDDAMALCDEAASGSPEKAAGLRGMSMPTAARLLKAAAHRAAGDTVAARAQWQTALGTAVPWEFAWGLETLGLVYRDVGDIEGEMGCFEEIVARYGGSEDTRVQLAWRSAVIQLMDAYQRLSPPGAELAAAHCARVLARDPDALRWMPPEPDRGESPVDLSVRLQRHMADYTERVVGEKPDIRVLQYLRLWERGYYEYMEEYLTGPATRGTGPGSFAARLTELAEEGVRPTSYQILGWSTSEDGATATVRATVQLECELPPDFVSGEVLFELAEEEWSYPRTRRVWMIEKGVPVP